MIKVLLFLSLFLFNSIAHAQTGPSTNICLVTVDTTFTHNVIVWERASQASAIPIDSIRIYRAKLLGGDTLVGSVHWDSVSQFRDYSADPNLRPYRYRISGVDSQGLEGPLSLPHQTIHFAILEQGDSIRLRWTKYMGENIIIIIVGLILQEVVQASTFYILHLMMQIQAGGIVTLH